MASNTERLDLLMKDPVTDGDDTFNIEAMLNDNWKKIDERAALLDPVTKKVPSDQLDIDTSNLATKQELSDTNKTVATHLAEDATDAHTPKNVGLGNVINELQATHTDVFGDNAETIQTVKPGNDFSTFGYYGIVFQPKQTLNLKNVKINAENNGTDFKIALSEWYEDITRIIEEVDSLYSKEFKTVEGYNKYDLDFIIPADGKKYFLWIPGIAPKLNRVGGFTPPENPYIDFLFAGRSIPNENDNPDERETRSNWYWFFDWEVEPSIQQMINVLAKKKGSTGKKWASGTIADFRSANSTAKAYSGTVTGLDFFPKTVVIYCGEASNTRAMSVSTIDNDILHEELNHFSSGSSITAAVNVNTFESFREGEFDYYSSGSGSTPRNLRNVKYLAIE